MNKIKKFDSVKMMRNIREKMNKKYLDNPVDFKKDLEIIKEKFGIVKKGKNIKSREKLIGKI